MTDTEKAAAMHKRGAAALCLLASSLLPGSILYAYAAPATHTVVMEGVTFTPQTLTVKQGDTIVWANKDLFPHTATAQDGSFDSREIPVSKSWKYVAKKVGTHSYVCTLHPTMKATLIVQ